MLNRNTFNVNTAIIYLVFQRTQWYHRHLCSIKSDVWAVNCSCTKIERPQSYDTNAWNFMDDLFIYIFLHWVTVKQIKKKDADCRKDLLGNKTVASLLKRWGSLRADLRPIVKCVAKGIKWRSTILHLTLWAYKSQRWKCHFKTAIYQREYMSTLHTDFDLTLWFLRTQIQVIMFFWLLAVKCERFRRLKYLLLLKTDQTSLVMIYSRKKVMV